MTQHSRYRGHTPEDSDALRELGNVAFSHAATALSALVGRRVDLSIPSLEVVSISEAERSIDSGEQTLCVITLRLFGERRGLLALVFAEADALALSDLLEGQSVGTRQALTPQAESMLAEVANIMSGAALLAMYRFLKVSLIHGTPMVHLRRAKGHDRAAARLAWGSDICVIVETTFAVEGKVVRGEMIISLVDLEFFLDALMAHGGG